jgi:excisionase family DNA binding protein
MSDIKDGLRHQQVAPAAALAGEWLTAAEAAEYAGGIGVCTVRQACNVNRLRHVRIGGGTTGPIRTRREWVDQWMQQWERGGQAA